MGQKRGVAFGLMLFLLTGCDNSLSSVVSSSFNNSLSSEFITLSSDNSLDESISLESSSYGSEESSQEESSSEIFYQVSFLNWDLTLLYETSVRSGETAIYLGETPSRPANNDLTYTFSGWDYSLENIICDCDRIAQFSTSARAYLVRYLNYDGTVLQENSVGYLQSSPYLGENPIRGDDRDGFYEFAGWNGSGNNIVNDTDIYATYLQYDFSSLENFSFRYDASAMVYYISGIAGTLLEDVYIPYEYNNLPIIGLDNNAYRNNYAIRYLRLSDNIQSVGEYALYSCANLADVRFSPNLVLIDMFAFYYCIKLTRVILPDGLESIVMNAFQKDNAITELYLPDTISYIGSSAFSECSSLAEVEIPPLITSLSSYLFQDCTSLMHVVIPSNVTYINLATFSGCSSLSQVSLAEGVWLIDYRAFAYNYSLQSIVLPLSLENLSHEVFYGSTSIHVFISAEEVPSGFADGWNSTIAAYYLYRETNPGIADTYWHYVDGIPTMW